VRIVHRVGINATPEIRSELATLGVVVGQGLAVFLVDEGHPRWPEIAAWIARRRAVDFVLTEFEQAEVDAAPWVALAPSWHQGYPQPEEGYLEATYDLGRHCRACGIGVVQRAPFRMKGEPRWGRNEVLQLTWVFDEYFVTPALFRRVFEPFGVPAREVLDARGARSLATVVQLVVRDEVDVADAGLPFDTCDGCGRAKFLPHVRGPFPRVLADGSTPLVRTRAWFGSGASAHHVVLATAALARTLKGVRGMTLQPALR